MYNQRTQGMTSLSKKAKTTSEEDEAFEKVKQYILECPHVASDHPAIRAAVRGLDKELERRQRDARLQAKFTGEARETEVAGGEQASPSNLSESVVLVDSSKEAKSSPADLDETDEMMDWQDVSKKDDNDVDDDVGSSSYLGRKLAKVAIETLSQNNVRVKSPIGAIAAVLHASLRSDMMGFACTGIPADEASSSSGGFAPPIRDLPKSQLFPSSWDANPSKVQLRYRKNGASGLVLRVEEVEKDQIRVQFARNANEQALVFDRDAHINTDSWAKALQSSSSIAPALHYKALDSLLSDFTRAFDIGPVPVDDKVEAYGTPYMDSTIQNPLMNTPGIKSGGPRKGDFVNPDLPQVPTTIGEAFPVGNPRGDFSTDVMPGGLVDPRFTPGIPPPGGYSGNLMGPNHPAFRGPAGFGPTGGPGTMQPRFDPFGPPGGPQEIDPNGEGNPRTRRRIPGEPNPDHLPPPNAFGNNNMFM